MDQESRWDVGHDDDGNHPAEDEFEGSAVDGVRVAPYVEEAVVTVNQTLGSDHPETRGGEDQHDAVVDEDAAANRHDVEQDLRRRGDDGELPEREKNDACTDKRVDHIVHAELLERDDELRVDRQQEHEVHPAGPDEFRKICQIHVEEGLKELADQLVCSNEQDDLPFRPSADHSHVGEDHLDEDDLAQEPEHLHEHPEQKVEFETHLADERVPEHHPIDFQEACAFGAWRCCRSLVVGSATTSLTRLALHPKSRRHYREII